ncbi:DEAD/DEAH box helicase family protein [Acetonema longum]|uniref:Type I restriction-modification system R subunit (Endonuclease) n=1 Tax=Acetonema longum DSM 6540 TaxID=1009370 RepID=F7NKM9_9FIRM|nr:DEAD/DEAH box helicase family protein [Acetonema longum]EGO63406.1 type I restriction-modification system R subunit (endonuclease) [Acetonema longum DSM 6540]
MPANFDFLQEKAEYQLFSPAAIETERVLATSPAMAAVGARKALELAVKWVYSADNTISMPYKNNLQALIHEPTFRFALDHRTWGKLPYIIKLGNLAVHTEKAVSFNDAVLSLSGLFEFIQWIDYCYGSDYEERRFDEHAIPQGKPAIDDSIIKQKDAEIEKLLAQIAEMSGALTAQKDQHKEEREFNPEDISEFQTRKRYIDVDLQLLGWIIGDDAKEEVALAGMPNSTGTGSADYVLYGKDGLPLAVIEAKRTSKDPKIGTHQAKLYADCLERMTGRRPIMFTTNGFETYIWDDCSSPQRQVSGVFSRADLEKLMSRRTQRRKLTAIDIQDRITDRYYQKEAIRAVCGNIDSGHRKSLLVMATGTGKTRTASSLTDVLSRGGYITNTLFLADRTALVRQARDDFKTYLPDMSLCNPLNGKEDKNARIVFSTYPTMLNSIDTAKSEKGGKLFTPAHFDLIIVDEAHRSIFKKYRAIFEYFDAYVVGLTATPKTDIDRNTYEFFEMENGVPTYAYDYDTAVYTDKVLVPYHNIEVRTKFLEQGIAYDELLPEDKARYEEDFTDEDGDMPDFVPPPAMNEFIFNQDTVDYVLEHLMTKGQKSAGGDKLGKSIIFAANHRHAVYIEERFNKLYPQYNGQFAQVIDNKTAYAQDRITDFKAAGKLPQIAISVDMLDTGIDVPEIVNLVFFKRVRSKTKFWQMIGRGTRFCKNLFGAAKDKQCFYIFDYLGNFEFFRQNPQGIESRDTESITESIFSKKVRLIHRLQDSAFAAEAYQLWRTGLIEGIVLQIQALNPELVSVKMQWQYVEKYKDQAAFVCLSDTDKRNLILYLAPLVYLDDTDEYAKGFDNLMYGMMLAQIEGLPQFKKGKRQLTDISAGLAKRISIPQVKEKIELIHSIQTDEFWRNADLLTLETVRAALRDLIKFIVDAGGRNSIYTNLADSILGVREGETIYPAYDFEDYRLKVNRYIEANKDNLAIHKLRNNIPLTAADYESLEYILTGDLGSRSDYEQAFGDTPFGLLVRKIGKLEYDAAMKVFSEFINDQALSQAQIVFVKKIVDYIVQNGYVENMAELMKPPFDKPVSFMKLFDKTKQQRIMELVTGVRENAVRVIG